MKPKFGYIIKIRDIYDIVVYETSRIVKLTDVSYTLDSSTLNY